MRYSKKYRPKIKLKRAFVDYFYEIGTWTLYGGCILFIAMNYGNLPEIVPSHLNGKGEIDGAGSKSFLWIFLIIGLVFAMIIQYTHEISHTFGFKVEITEENALYQYTNAVRMMRFLNFSIAGSWLVILMAMMETANGRAIGGVFWLIIPLIVLTILGLTYYTKLSYKVKKV